MTIRWIDLPEPLAGQLDDLPALVAQGQGEVVKERPQRTIYRVHLAGHDLHVKHCKVRGWRAWLRERLRAPKACLEYSKLHAALARRVPTVQPIACGAGRAQSLLVTSTIAGAVPLTQRLEASLSPCRRFALAEALGKFTARVHDAGVLHPDPHPGNFLIRDTELFLLDLHDARIARSLSESEIIANLVRFNRWFILRTNRSDRLRFWRAYAAERLRVDYFRADDVEQRTWRSNLRFWRSRVKRCVAENRRFRRIGFDNVAGYAVREWADDAAHCNLDALFA